MKKLVKLLSIVLLVFLGLGGVFGGWMLISDPSGSKFEWSLDLLNGTPFKTFLIPGIALFLSNGLLPLLVAAATIRKKRNAGWLIFLQGCITIGWLSMQLIFNPQFFQPVTHYPSYSIGVLLVIGGLLLKRK